MTYLFGDLLSHWSVIVPPTHDHLSGFILFDSLSELLFATPSHCPMLFSLWLLTGRLNGTFHPQLYVGSCLWRISSHILSNRFLASIINRSWTWTANRKYFRSRADSGKQLKGKRDNNHKCYSTTITAFLTDWILMDVTAARRITVWALDHELAPTKG